MTERVSRPRVKAPSQLPSAALGSADPMPLAHLLDSGFSEHTVPVLWHRIQGQLHQPKQRSGLPLGLSVPWALAMAGAVLILGLWGFDSFKRANDPLRLSSGQLPAALVAEATPRRVELSDGSNIRVAQQSRLEVVSNEKTTFVTALSRGSATFEVNPEAKRRWIVEVGLTSVEVVGTRFTVTRTDSEVNVSVERGLVLVRGAAVPGGQQRLGAGQALTTKTTLEPQAAAETAERRGATGSAAPAETAQLDADDPADDALNDAEAKAETEPAPSQHTRSTRVSTSSSKARTSGRTEPAVPATTEPEASQGSRKSKPATAVALPTNIEALLEEADRARQAGDLGTSLHYFEQVIRLAPHFDPRRGLAAMSVARMTMRGNPSRAAAALSATLDGMPLALQEPAIARLVEAYAKSGQTKEAQRMAERYLERFPNGRRAEDVRRWANP